MAQVGYEEERYNLQTVKNLKTEEFKRFCGVHLETFTRMVKEIEPDLERTGKRGS